MKRRILLGLIILIPFIFLNNNYFQKTKLLIESEKVDKEYKIIQISDSHEKDFPKYFYKNVQEENPDLIIHTGDFAMEDCTEKSLVMLEKLSKIAPIIIVQGNHDEKVWENFKADISSLGNIFVLDNESFVFNELRITGLVNSYYKSKGFVKSVEMDEYFNICALHNHEHFKKYNFDGFDYFLSGHTHGGQWRIFGRPLISPKRKWFPEINYGKMNINGVDGYVNRGLGNPKYIFRLNNFPEITILNIKPIKKD